MLKENKEIFDLCNITQWQKDNLGEGTTIVLIDECDTPYDYMKHVVEVPFPNKNDMGHITAVGAVGYQIAPKANIIYMPFNDSKNAIREKMIDWIIKNKDEIDVINVSLDFRKSITDKYFLQLEATGIPIICASGNDGYEDKVAYPSRYPFTISVGAYSPNSGGTTYYSNGGKELDCIASASTYRATSEGKIVSQFGTSFASPFVAFSLALYFSWRKRNNLPKLTTEEVRQFIKGNAKDLYEEGHDYKSGYGLFILPSEIPTITKQPTDTVKEGVDNMARFTDIEKHWAKDTIEFVAEKGLMKGYEEGEPGPKDDTFRPDNPITRAEVATVIARMNGFVEKK